MPRLHLQDINEALEEIQESKQADALAMDNTIDERQTNSYTSECAQHLVPLNHFMSFFNRRMNG